MAAPVDHLPELARLLGEGNVLVLSGAGMSTGSGIPDYRGLGRRPRGVPIDYRQFVSDEGARRRYWARSHAGWRRIARAEPNPGHRAVADLEQAGLVTGLITQNVDGLHSAAGSVRVLELHGSLARTVCLDCGERRSRLELQHRLAAANPHFDPPAVDYAPDGDAGLPEGVVESFQVVDCLSCRGVLKPDVVFFGENVAREKVMIAFRWLLEASSLLVLGSSLTVMSGYRFVVAAHRSGQPVAIVNQGPTRGDGQATIRVEGELGEVLGRLSKGFTRFSTKARRSAATRSGDCLAVK